MRFFFRNPTGVREGKRIVFVVCVRNIQILLRQLLLKDVEHDRGYKTPTQEDFFGQFGGKPFFGDANMF